MMTKRLHIVTAFAVVLLLGLLPAAARAGQAELDLLASYIGKWSGDGVLVGGKAPESFRCRLTIAKGNQAKINYSGRCTLVNMNLSVAGTIGYDDASRRYQAVMSSNAGFTGYAIGLKQGDQISFDLAERQTDRGGNDVRIGSTIRLIGDSITVDFEVEFNNSGDLLTASVPFAR
ncbi:MAG: hypothetical protein HY834_06005 [Devosia nanyangense]|uniref:DUF1794 domain-containing protein n=1 Tax=Devosia nanyangense TaxID=1228055 RepID=A0A933KZ60_9HYPH|nr:hypothetical protein [Devosia nanyangense]